ncbi:MAG: radical SAM protein [Deltaproteobacteria bacterium]|nr:radical SAM protein [Deltaproteobacteria bacterium]
MLPEEVAALAGVPLPDARRLVSCIHKQGRLPERCPATVRRVSLDAVRAAGALPTLELVERQASAVDPFVKYAFRAADSNEIESVRIPLEKPGRFSVCVSSQVGCALACAFCATGKMGLLRNLEAWEIVEQLRLVRAELPEGTRVHGVVFQGMGEPLANLENVLAAIRVFSEPSAHAIDRRNMTVCTAGLSAGIRRLAREQPDVRIGLSIGDVRFGRREALMPIERAHSLEEVLEALAEHTRATRNAPMWAYTMLAGQNDDDDAAAALATRLLAFAEATGVRPRLSLIPWNQVEGAAFERSSEETLSRFRARLRERGVGTIVRYSGGGDVAAACGQLARTPASGLVGRGSLRKPQTVRDGHDDSAPLDTPQSSAP